MRKVKLNQSGVDFLRSALSAGDYLAELLNTLPLEEGAVYTFLPNGADPAQLSLAAGGLSQINYVDDLQRPIEQLILNFLRSSPENVAVIEATSIEKEKLSSWLANTPVDFKYFTLNRTRRTAKDPVTQTTLDQVGVYGMLMADQAKLSYVKDFIEEAFPFQKIGMLSSSAEAKFPHVGQEVEMEWLRRLAARAQYIFASAYDGAGMVVWSAHKVDKSI
jgi:hypothetical protein